MPRAASRTRASSDLAAKRYISSTSRCASASPPPCAVSAPSSTMASERRSWALAGVFAQRRARLLEGGLQAVLLQGEAADALDDGGKFHFVRLGIVGKKRVEVGFQQARQRREQLHIRAGEALFPLVDGLRRDAKALGHLFLRERKRLAARKDGFSKSHTFPSLTVSRKTARAVLQFLF